MRKLNESRFDDDDLPWTKWADFILSTGRTFKDIPKTGYVGEPPHFVSAAVANKDPMIEKIKRLLGNHELIDKLGTMDEITLRRLVQASHPDKHGGSALSIEVTQWLNEKRQQL